MFKSGLEFVHFLMADTLIFKLQFLVNKMIENYNVAYRYFMLKPLTFLAHLLLKIVSLLCGNLVSGWIRTSVISVKMYNGL